MGNRRSETAGKRSTIRRDGRLGDTTKIAEKVCHHFDAGADHLAVQVLTSTPDIAPLDELRRLAPLIL